MTDDVRAARKAFAGSLEEFESQRQWYSARASTFKSRAQRLDLTIIVCGVLIAALPILKPGGPAHWTEVLISFLGAGVALGQGAQRVFRFAETWPEYRLASERMKREYRLFVNGIDEYLGEDPKAQAQYVKRLEEIVAEEQKIFFDTNRVSNDKKDQK
jgi:hypothetical protein